MVGKLRGMDFTKMPGCFLEVKCKTAYCLRVPLVYVPDFFRFFSCELSPSLFL